MIDEGVEPFCMQMIVIVVIDQHMNRMKDV